MKSIKPLKIQTKYAYPRGPEKACPGEQAHKHPYITKFSPKKSNLEAKGTATAPLTHSADLRDSVPTFSLGFIHKLTCI